MEGNAWQVGAWRLGHSISSAPLPHLRDPLSNHAPGIPRPSIGLALPAGTSYNNFCHSLSCRCRANSYLFFRFFSFFLYFFFAYFAFFLFAFFLGRQGARRRVSVIATRMHFNPIEYLTPYSADFSGWELTTLGSKKSSEKRKDNK